jgi:hypothetical protein
MLSYSAYSIKTIILNLEKVLTPFLEAFLSFFCIFFLRHKVMKYKIIFRPLSSQRKNCFFLQKLFSDFENWTIKKCPKMEISKKFLKKTKIF